MVPLNDRMVLCDGSPYDPETYPELFKRIGWNYGIQLTYKRHESHSKSASQAPWPMFTYFEDGNGYAMAYAKPSSTQTITAYIYRDSSSKSYDITYDRSQPSYNVFLITVGASAYLYIGERATSGPVVSPAMFYKYDLNEYSKVWTGTVLNNDWTYVNFPLRFKHEDKYYMVMSTTNRISPYTERLVLFEFGESSMSATTIFEISNSTGKNPIDVIYKWSNYIFYNKSGSKYKYDFLLKNESLASIDSLPESRTGTSNFNRYGGIAIDNKTFYGSGGGLRVTTISEGSTSKTSIIAIKVPNKLGFDSELNLNGYNTIVNDVQPAYVGKEGIILFVKIKRKYPSGSTSRNDDKALIVVAPYLEDYPSDTSYLYGLPQLETASKYTTSYMLTAPNCPWPYISAGYSDSNNTSDQLYVYEISKPLLPSYVTNNNEYPTYIVVK